MRGREEGRERDGWTFNLRPVLSEVPLVHFWAPCTAAAAAVLVGATNLTHTHEHSVHMNAARCQLPWVGERALTIHHFVHQLDLAAI